MDELNIYFWNTCIYGIYTIAMPLHMISYEISYV